MISSTSIVPQRVRGQDQAEVLLGISYKTIDRRLKQGPDNAREQVAGLLSCPRPDLHLGTARLSDPKRDAPKQGDREPGHLSLVHPVHVHRVLGHRVLDHRVLGHRDRGRLVYVRQDTDHRAQGHLLTGHPAIVHHGPAIAQFTVQGFGIGLTGDGDGVASATIGGPGRPPERSPVGVLVTQVSRCTTTTAPRSTMRAIT